MRVRQALLIILLAALLPAVSAAAGNRVLPIRNIVPPGETPPGQNYVHHRCLTPIPGEGVIDLGLEREKPWSLPKQALAVDALDTIHCLVLRYDFQYETVDDPNTTGRGHMVLADPEADPASADAYFDSVGHWIDSPPHDSLYFDAHMRALARYWEVVSDGKITLTWDIFPPRADSVYELPHPMSHYGRCDFDEVVAGLEQYFIDCIQLADTVSPEIEFGNYESIFLFHAGSDRQNDIGFPPTCNDLFTGFIAFGDSLGVDHDSVRVRNALMMPETANQDNRATALNAVMAHEFGHQLGLVDLYSTRTFMTQLGDFSLMDNNGFGTGVDFGFPVGNVFGTIPLYPEAWSRAFLGFAEVHDFRRGTDIELAAAQMAQEGIKVARIPISENEYYLLENRLVEYDGIGTGQRLDSVRNVLQGPVDTINGDFTREYDILMPGSGMLVFLVDESVAAADINEDGDNNFSDNQLQWVYNHKFITLIEADGIIDFGGYYRSGYGSPEDMYRDDRNTSFTPNTNPPSIDNTGNNTHIRLTGITRVKDTAGASIIIHDSLMLFDVETEGLVENFPIRVGAPSLPLGPIAADLNRDGTDEIIAASGRRILAFTTEGENFLSKVWGTPDSLFFDTSRATVHPGKIYPVPMFGLGDSIVLCGPVAGDFGNGAGPMVVAAGRKGGALEVRFAADTNYNGLAEPAFIDSTMVGDAIAILIQNDLYYLTNAGNVYRLDSLEAPRELVGTFAAEQYHGICALGDGLVLVGGDETRTVWYAIEPDGDYDSLVVDGVYRYGPILVDVDRDGVPEVVGFTEDGDGILISADPAQTPPQLSVALEKSTGWTITTNPVAGDVDDDGYPDIIAGGENRLLAFDRNLILVTDFPKRLDDRYPESEVIAAPVVADIRRGGDPEVLVPTDAGNIYAYGEDLAYGFPLSGGEITAGSVLTMHDSLGGKLGYVGADGWFYLWQTDADTTRDFWPMAGANPGGTLAFDELKLGEPKTYGGAFDEKQFYNYPNPVSGRRTTIRYFLNRDASRVALTVYDLSGAEVAALNGPTAGGVPNEIEWPCGGLTPGVYRCRIEVDFGGETETAFTDIAILR